MQTRTAKDILKLSIMYNLESGQLKVSLYNIDILRIKKRY